jgi:hypothetical protein
MQTIKIIPLYAYSNLYVHISAYLYNIVYMYSVYMLLSIPIIMSPMSLYSFDCAYSNIYIPLIMLMVQHLDDLPMSVSTASLCDFSTVYVPVHMHKMVSVCLLVCL